MEVFTHCGIRLWVSLRSYWWNTANCRLAFTCSFGFADRLLRLLCSLVRSSAYYVFKEGMSFLDIGAGIGLASALAARIWSVSITVIEPDESMRIFFEDEFGVYQAGGSSGTFFACFVVRTAGFARWYWFSWVYCVRKVCHIQRIPWRHPSQWQTYRLVFFWGLLLRFRMLVLLWLKRISGLVTLGPFSRRPFPSQMYGILCFRRFGVLKGKELAGRRNSFVLLSDVSVYGEFRIFILAKTHILSRSLSLVFRCLFARFLFVFRPVSL